MAVLTSILDGIIFTTRTLPGNYFKISGFRVVTTRAFFSPNQNVHPPSPIPYSEIEFRPQTTLSTCHQKFAFRPVDGSASDLRVIKNCSHITSKSLRVIVDELAMFWQFIKNCSQTFGSGLRAITWCFEALTVTDQKQKIGGIPHICHFFFTHTLTGLKSLHAKCIYFWQKLPQNKTA